MDDDDDNDQEGGEGEEEDGNRWRIDGFEFFWRVPTCL